MHQVTFHKISYTYGASCTIVVYGLTIAFEQQRTDNAAVGQAVAYGYKFRYYVVDKKNIVVQYQYVVYSRVFLHKCESLVVAARVTVVCL